MDAVPDNDEPVLTELLPLGQSMIIARLEQPFEAGAKPMVDEDVNGGERVALNGNELDCEYLSHEGIVDSTHTSPDETDQSCVVSPPIRSPSPPFTPAFCFEGGEDEFDLHRDVDAEDCVGNAGTDTFAEPSVIEEERSPLVVAEKSEPDESSRVTSAPDVVDGGCLLTSTEIPPTGAVAPSSVSSISPTRRERPPKAETRPVPNLTPIASTAMQNGMCLQSEEKSEPLVLPATRDERLEKFISYFRERSATAKKTWFKRVSEEEKARQGRHVLECIDSVAKGAGGADDSPMTSVDESKREERPCKRKKPPELKKPQVMDEITDRHCDECIADVARGVDSLSIMYGVALDRTEGDDERCEASAALPPPPPPPKKKKLSKIARPASNDMRPALENSEAGPSPSRRSIKARKKANRKNDRARTNDLVHCVFGDGPGQAAYRRKGAHGNYNREQRSSVKSPLFAFCKQSRRKNPAGSHNFLKNLPGYKQAIVTHKIKSDSQRKKGSKREAVTCVDPEPTPATHSRPAPAADEAEQDLLPSDDFFSHDAPLLERIRAQSPGLVSAVADPQTPVVAQTSSVPKSPTPSTTPTTPPAPRQPEDDVFKKPLPPRLGAPSKTSAPVLPKSILKKPSLPKEVALADRDDNPPEPPMARSDSRRNSGVPNAASVARRNQTDLSDTEAPSPVKKRVEDRVGASRADDGGKYVYPKTPVPSRSPWSRKSPPPPSMSLVSQASIKNINAGALKQRNDGVQTGDSLEDERVVVMTRRSRNSSGASESSTSKRKQESLRSRKHRRSRELSGSSDSEDEEDDPRSRTRNRGRMRVTSSSDSSSENSSSSDDEDSSGEVYSKTSQRELLELITTLLQTRKRKRKRRNRSGERSGDGNQTDQSEGEDANDMIAALLKNISGKKFSKSSKREKRRFRRSRDSEEEWIRDRAQMLGEHAADGGRAAALRGGGARSPAAADAPPMKESAPYANPPPVNPKAPAAITLHLNPDVANLITPTDIMSCEAFLCSRLDEQKRKEAKQAAASSSRLVPTRDLSRMNQIPGGPRSSLGQETQADLAMRRLALGMGMPIGRYSRVDGYIPSRSRFIGREEANEPRFPLPPRSTSPPVLTLSDDDDDEVPSQETSSFPGTGPSKRVDDKGAEEGEEVHPARRGGIDGFRVSAPSPSSRPRWHSSQVPDDLSVPEPFESDHESHPGPSRRRQRSVGVPSDAESEFSTVSGYASLPQKNYQVYERVESDAESLYREPATKMRNLKLLQSRLSRLQKHTPGAHDLLRPNRAERLLKQLSDPKKAKYVQSALARVHDRMVAHQGEHMDVEDDSWRALRGYDSDQERRISAVAYFSNLRALLVMPNSRRKAATTSLRREHVKITYEAEVKKENVLKSPAECKKRPRRAKKEATVDVDESDAAMQAELRHETKWEPENWRHVYDNIRVMRKNYDAPVDDMGCEQCADATADAKVFRFHNLVALMLSAQTKDQITHAAMGRLKEHGLSIEMVLSTPEEKIRQLIYPVGFYKRKSVYIKQVAQILKDQYDGDIPDSVEGLCSLPGVGPKMAYLCMQCAWNSNSGIGVDTHVHRIANRLGWLKVQSKNPEETRKGLEDWLPSELWREVNWMLVGFGQTVCTPLRPKCVECLNKDLCPTGRKEIKAQSSASPKKKKR